MNLRLGMGSHHYSLACRTSRKNGVGRRNFTFAVCLLIVGCCPHTLKTSPKNYSGPTKPMAEVVSAINENNVSITTIYSDHHFWAWLHDAKHHERRFDGDGALLYRKLSQKPDELLMTGEVVTGKVFELGSTSGADAQYWLKVMPPGDEPTEWWGHYKNLGKPCSENIPIQPNLVTEVLGLEDIDTNFLQQPAPVMRFSNEMGVYQFTWNVQLPDRWAAVKEVWFDVHTLLPTKVLLYDPDGRQLLEANLSEHQVVEGTQGKKIATRYDLSFPQTQDSLVIQLKNPKLQYRNRPRAGLIRRLPLKAGQEIQIDENCP